MSISDQFMVRNLDTGEVFRPPFAIDAVDAPLKLPLASPDDIMEFKKQFSTFPYDEKLLHVVKCMLWESLSSFQARKIKKRHPGTIFISNRHLSFAEETSALKKSVKIGIPLSEIIDLTAEDYGLSEGIVVSTMRDTKFFFEQFPSRNDSFYALYRTWTLLASIFDPLGGISAVTANAVRNAVASPSDSLSPSNGSMSAPLPKPQAAKQPAQHVTPSTPRITPPQLSSRQGRPSHSEDEHHFMDLKSGDSWFMTLTKIYYWLGVHTRQPRVRTTSATT